MAGKTRHPRGEHHAGDNPEAFLDELALELRLRGVPVFRSELRQRVKDAWPLIDVDPCVGHWASAYQEQYRGQPAGAD
jgi:hypothetical protein